MGALSQLPLKVLAYKGATLQDMDVGTIRARNPEIVLIDELAHKNVPGSLHAKRYEDVLELLDAGISVIATMNIQHLESLHDVIEGITGIRIREFVPDDILHAADEVELIDVAPNALQQRIRAGKVYANHKVEQSLGGFFKLGNLIALRELADDVDECLKGGMGEPGHVKRSVAVQGIDRRERIGWRSCRMSYSARLTGMCFMLSKPRGSLNATRRRRRRELRLCSK